jgi:hypothetical protein
MESEDAERFVSRRTRAVSSTRRGVTGARGAGLSALYDFQVEGVKWMKALASSALPGGCLADEMRVAVSLFVGSALAPSKLCRAPPALQGPRKDRTGGHVPCREFGGWSVCAHRRADDDSLSVAGNASG